MIIPLHNDVLTRVRHPIWGNWPIPKEYFAGSVIQKRPDLKFRITGFETSKFGDAVYARGYYLGDSRHKTVLLIGDKKCFKEKLIV